MIISTYISVFYRSLNNNSNQKYTEDELTHIQLYETTSEGTPKSPVFPKEDFDKLCEYVAEHVTTFAHFRATKDEWKEMLSSGFVYHKSGNVIFI